MHDKRLFAPLLISIGILIIGGLLWLSPTLEPVEPVLPEPPSSIVPAEPLISSSTIGLSVEGRAITAYQFGSGKTPLLLVGGIHGGYEWNTVVLAYEMIDYFTANLYAIPPNLTIHIIPNANPDGLAMVTGGRTGRISATDVTAWSADGRGRFNAQGVDLNRNFDCKWSPAASWRGRPVGAGTAPFSEPEAAALRDYILATEPIAGVFWHSVANAVYGSECHEGILPLTLEIMNRYASAARYSAIPAFTAYPVVGDVEGWLATRGIAAITVELETRESSEWNRNLAGTLAVIEYLGEIDSQ